MHNILERELQKPFILNIPIVVFERTMKRSETLQKLAAHRDELTQMGVKTLAVFGSVARDEAGPDSDVDIMVEFQGPATFNGYMDLKFFLEDLLGCPVDLVTRKSIRSRLKTQIENEALYVHYLLFLEDMQTSCEKILRYTKGPVAQDSGLEISQFTGTSDWMRRYFGIFCRSKFARFWIRSIRSSQMGLNRFLARDVSKPRQFRPPQRCL